MLLEDAKNNVTVVHYISELMRITEEILLNTIGTLPYALRDTEIQFVALEPRKDIGGRMIPGDGSDAQIWLYSLSTYLLMVRSAPQNIWRYRVLMIFQAEAWNAKDWILRDGRSGFMSEKSSTFNELASKSSTYQHPFVYPLLLVFLTPLPFIGCIIT